MSTCTVLSNGVRVSRIISLLELMRCLSLDTPLSVLNALAEHKISTPTAKKLLSRVRFPR